MVADLIRDFVLRTPPNVGGGIRDLLRAAGAAQAERASTESSVLLPLPPGPMIAVVAPPVSVQLSSSKAIAS